jgi:ABC-type branched-subunit amino acid transport system ATPase component
MSTLSVETIDVFYGQAQALHGASLTAQSPGVTCLLGRNGVGKTTMLRAIMGLQKVDRGQLVLDGRVVTAMPPHARAALGIRLVPRDQVVFPGLTVKDHLDLARATRARRSPLAQSSPAQSSGEQWTDYFPVLRERLSQRADTLSGGERKMLAISQALLGGAEFLLMDEPTEGVQPSIVESIAASLVEIGKSIGVLLVEQNLDVVSFVGGDNYIMEKGAIAAQGPFEDLERSGHIERYLGL